MNKKRISEFPSYTYIKNELKRLGWNTNSPNRDSDGQLYTQEECLDNLEIKSMLNKKRPEYIVKIKEDIFWVIEAKGVPERIDEAYEQAIERAEIINHHEFIKAMFVSGVAGNDIDKYQVRSGYWNSKKNTFEIIEHEDKELTSLLRPDVVLKLLEQNSSILKEYEIPENILLGTAERINIKMHESSIKKDERATIVATMLLSLMGETEPNYNASPPTFVKDINNRAFEVLEDNDKGDYTKYIEIHLPDKAKARNKFKEALVDCMFQLKKVDIRSAMKSGSDILGKFYETFLKYGNGAKDLGIVLTPRNITDFASDILDISHKDLIYDPCCGTGGFLVSALYHVKEKSTKEQFNEFKRYRIFGVDQQSKITTLAIVNMIFRGDGHNNIINDDCLSCTLSKDIIDNKVSGQFVIKKNNNIKSPITKVLMNPPFSLKKEEEKAYKFVQHALDQMEDGGLLFSILPYSTMVKSGTILKWKKNILLKNNTLLSVITPPYNMFYPSPSSIPIFIFVRKGVPHPTNQNVLWIRAINDGLRKKKGKRIPDSRIPNDFKTIKETIKAFINDPTINVENIPEFQKAIPINYKEKSFELVPEEYLDLKIPTQGEIEEGIEQLIRDTTAFIIKSKKEMEFQDDNN